MFIKPAQDYIPLFCQQAFSILFLAPNIWWPFHNISNHPKLCGRNSQNKNNPWGSCSSLTERRSSTISSTVFEISLDERNSNNKISNVNFLFERNRNDSEKAQNNSVHTNFFICWKYVCVWIISSQFHSSPAALSGLHKYFNQTLINLTREQIIPQGKSTLDQLFVLLLLTHLSRTTGSNWKMIITFSYKNFC